MGFFDSLRDGIKQIFKLDIKANQSAINANKKLSIVQAIVQPEQSVGPSQHPLHKARLLEYAKQISKLSKAKPLMIGYGDSLSDFARDKLKSHDGVYSIMGSWGFNFKQMIVDTYPLLIDKKVTFITIGTFGNAALGHQNWDLLIVDAKDVLDTARKLYPKARLVLYGFPPVNNLYAAQNTLNFDKFLYDWMNVDVGDSVMLELKTRLGGFFPNAQNSVDGVHLSLAGKIKFNQMFEEAKKVANKTVIL